jgi:hypothetical protein
MSPGRGSNASLANSRCSRIKRNFWANGKGGLGIRN